MVTQAWTSSEPAVSNTAMNDLVSILKRTLKDPCSWAENAAGIKLRNYQLDVARAVVDSVVHNLGLSFVVMFPRQSGKNELQAHIESYLLTILSAMGAEIVKISPTYKPQTLNAMRRLDRALSKNLVTSKIWTKEAGYIYRMGAARIFFLSGAPEANIVGATASTLLEVDEAQDVTIEKFDKDIAPMAASTNATRVFWGTAWTSRTLLHRELVAAREQEKTSGKRQVFVIDAPRVAKEVPAYGKFVAEQVARLGRNNPMVKTQYFSEEIDAEGGMFPPARRAIMQGDHPRWEAPREGCIYAVLVDVAGEDEGIAAEPGQLQNPGRDSTTLTVVEVDLSGLADPIIHKPVYRVMTRRSWTGVKHTTLYGQIKAIAEHWKARHLVIDATGIGAGLASFLDASLPGKVIPFVFSSSTKSKLGWDFISVADGGRFKDYAPDPVGAVNQPPDPLYADFFHQLEFCQYEIVPGPEKKMKWGVPDGTRDPATGELMHDDLILSAALVGALDELEWSITGPALVVQGKDPLEEMDEGW